MPGPAAHERGVSPGCDEHDILLETLTHQIDVCLLLDAQIPLCTITVPFRGGEPLVEQSDKRLYLPRHQCLFQFQTQCGQRLVQIPDEQYQRCDQG